MAECASLFRPTGVRCMGKNVISGKPAGAPAGLSELYPGGARLPPTTSLPISPTYSSCATAGSANSERTPPAHRPRPCGRPYGPAEIEQLDIFRTERSTDGAGAPVFVFHSWRARGGPAPPRPIARARRDVHPRRGALRGARFPLGVQDAEGRPVAGSSDQVCRAIAWVYENAASFGGDRDRLYIGGHSSGAHLAAISR